MHTRLPKQRWRGAPQPVRLGITSTLLDPRGRRLQGGRHGRMTEGFDASRPNIARVYDYWLGGKDNFKADREQAEKLLRIHPGIAGAVRANRQFVGRAVTW